MGPPPAAFAAGLARKKPKVDPYDIHSAFAADSFRFARHDELALSETEMNHKRPDRWEKDTSGKAPEVDARVENPDLDVDEKIRSQFVDARYVMRDENRSLSRFEKNNMGGLNLRPSSTIKSMVGGKVIGVVEQKVENRTEFRNRDGTYADGIDRGRMKKRYEEEWQQRLKERDEEMVKASGILREWLSLPEAEKVRRKEKAAKNFAEISRYELLDQSELEAVPAAYLQKTKFSNARYPPNRVQATSVSDQEDPASDEEFESLFLDPFTSKSTPSVSERASVYGDPVNDRESHAQQAESSRGRGGYRGSEVPRGYSKRFARSYTSRGHESDNSTANWDTGSWPRDSYSPAAHSVRSSDRGRRISQTYRPGPSRASINTVTDNSLASVASETIRIPDPGPTYGLLEDLVDLAKWRSLKVAKEYVSQVEKENEKALAASNTQGRIVCVTLHEPVQYNPTAIVDRLFAGVLQDIQFFVEERTALVTYVYPEDAKRFIEHVKSAQENSAHEYRRLQISAAWYGGVESKAVYPAQERTLGSVIAVGATRALLLNGIHKDTKLEVLSKDMRWRMPSRLLVKVRLIRATKRYVKNSIGNEAILEFACRYSRSPMCWIPC